MAFLVELRFLNGPSDCGVQDRPSQQMTDTRRSGAMRLFKRSSSATVVNPAAEPQTPSSTDSEKRGSLTNLPLRLRRRRTNTLIYKSEEDEQSATRLGQLFFSLPSEILAPIICHLSLQDIYSLRQSCRLVASVLHHNAFSITRAILEKEFPDDVLPCVYQLYPVPSPCTNLQYLLKMLHRLQKVDKVIYHTASYVQMKIYMLDIPGYRAASTPGFAFRIRLQLALQRPTWIMYHFLERYRTLLLEEHDRMHGADSSRFWNCLACKDGTNNLLNSYPRDEVLPTLHLMQLVLLHYRASTRAPSYNAIEGRIKRGKGATDEELDMFVLLGGLEELSKISQMQGSYNKRLEVVASFITKIRTAVDINQSNAKFGATPSRTRSKADLTKSLAPCYEMLMQDHLDRLPSLADLLIPHWLERVERENLYTGDPENLRAPFLWIQKILFGNDTNGDGEDDNNHLTIQQQQNAQLAAAQNPTTGPLHTMIPITTPLYGAPPV